MEMRHRQEGSQRGPCPPFWATSVLSLRVKLLRCPLIKLESLRGTLDPSSTHSPSKRLVRELKRICLLCALQPGLWWHVLMTPAWEARWWSP